jgi:hypothetical protein
MPYVKQGLQSDNYQLWGGEYVFWALSGVRVGMSAFPNSGRSDRLISGESKVSYRPIADILCSTIIRLAVQACNGL